MLVLTRKVGESVKIDGSITVTVGSFRGREVRLIFEAPKDVNIWRSELSDKSSKKIDNDD